MLRLRCCAPLRACAPPACQWAPEIATVRGVDAWVAALEVLCAIACLRATCVPVTLEHATRLLVDLRIRCLNGVQRVMWGVMAAGELRTARSLKSVRVKASGGATLDCPPVMPGMRPRRPAMFERRAARDVGGDGGGRTENSAQFEERAGQGQRRRNARLPASDARDAAAASCHV